MKFGLSWLKEHLETNLELAEITAGLTALGLEVDAVYDWGQELAPFKIAKIISVNPHENANSLQLCQVDVGSGELLQIVCGAKNPRPGLVTVLAPVGAVMPAQGSAAGMTIKASAIRGVQSNGMLCSAAELGVGDHSHAGIMELPANLQPGLSYAAAMGLNDPIIEVAITPNRADCFSVRGIARDLAAAGYGKLRPLPPLTQLPATPASAAAITLNDQCPWFGSVVIQGIDNHGPSPEWLQLRLQQAGIRQISPVVDITNYVMIDVGQPLHAYDLDQISGQVIIDYARSGEEFMDLKQQTHALDERCLVVRDSQSKRIMALAGVMGGNDSGCQAETTRILLEGAVFLPFAVAYSGQKTGLTSDARTRFERGIDPAMTPQALAYAAGLIAQLCGGQVTTSVIADHYRPQAIKISFDLNKHAERIGHALDPEVATRMLQGLGCVVTSKLSQLEVVPPSWRHDLRIPEDLTEELTRLEGYDKIGLVPLPPQVNHAATAATTQVNRKRHVVINRIRRALAGCGGMELLNWTFIADEWAQPFTTVPLLKLRNPISQDLGVMRPSLLPELLKKALKNCHNGQNGINFFEIGPIFSAEVSSQKMVLGGVVLGEAHRKHWQDGGKMGRSYDVYDAKALAMTAIEACGILPERITIVNNNPPGYYHPGRSVALTLGPKNILGYVGEIHPAVLQQLRLDEEWGRFCVYELDCDLLLQLSKSNKPGVYAVSPYPTVARDFAFIVPKAVAAADLTKAIASVDKTLITDVTIFDLYQGGAIPEGHKSLAVSVTLTPTKNTMAEAEITAICNKIIDKVTSQCGAKLRS